MINNCPYLNRDNNAYSCKNALDRCHIPKHALISYRICRKYLGRNPSSPKREAYTKTTEKFASLISFLNANKSINMSANESSSLELPEDFFIEHMENIENLNSFINVLNDEKNLSNEAIEFKKILIDYIEAYNEFDVIDY